VKKQKFDKKKTKLVTCKGKHRSYFIMKNVTENAGRKTLLAPILFIYLSTNYLVTLTPFTVSLTVSYARRWEDNIKMNLQEVGGGCGDWIELAQDRNRWRALVSTVMNIRVPKKRGIS
jgi:hypothetical protein